MKCIHNAKTNEVRRVSNEHASVLVATGFWSYTDKTKWKQHRKLHREVR